MFCKINITIKFYRWGNKLLEAKWQIKNSLANVMKNLSLWHWKTELCSNISLVCKMKEGENEEGREEGKGITKMFPNKI